MKKLFLVILFSIFLKPKISATTHLIIYNITTSVTCSVGDTLELYGTFSGDYVAATFSGTNTISDIFPIMVTASPYYVGSFVISGNETSFAFAEISHGQITGTIIVNSTVGVFEKSDKILPQIFPNPFISTIHIKSYGANYFSVSDVLGNLTLEGSLDAAINFDQTLELSELIKSGAYFLRLYDKNKMPLSIEKIIKK